MAKLVNALDLGPGDFGFESSSLSIRNLLINHFVIFKNMILPFTLQQLRILKAVAAKKVLQKRAEILYVSQPSLSKQIKLLEHRLGITLLNRENNTLSLTEGGKVFLQYSERILALCEESCRALNDVKNGDRGNLIVGASQTIGTYLMPRVVSFICSKLPSN